MGNSIGVFLSRWNFDLFLLVNLVLAGSWYVWAVRRVRSRLRWHPGQTWCFLIGLLLLALVYLGPIAAWSHTFFWAHMTQHLVVMMAAAPLLVLGAPITLAFWASSDVTRRRWCLPILRSQVVRVLTNPVVTWLFFAGVLLGVHFTAFYNLALTNHDVDIFIEQPLYLGAAFLFYLPLIGANLQPRRPSHAKRMLSLALMMLPEALVGAVIYFSPVLLYPSFAAARPFGLEPMIDQQLSGALMWALVMVVDTGWLMLAAVEWYSSEVRLGARLDKQLASEDLGASR